jgi:Transcriptional Coactivator p15 (PC4)
MGLRTQKRKSSADDNVFDDGFVAGGTDASDHPSKRSKTGPKSSSFATAGKTQLDSDGNQYWEISKLRRVTVSEFKGKRMISIREYYEKDRKELPGKKVRMSLFLEEFWRVS